MTEVHAEEEPPVGSRISFRSQHARQRCVADASDG